jgi:hypothetical protein
MRGCAAVGLHVCQHQAVVLGIDEYRHPAVILGGSADHRRAADVDVFDGILESGALPDGRFERIEVADEQVDPLDPVGLHGLGMIGLVAQRQKPAMDLRMQRLDATVHDLRKACDGRHVGDREPRGPQRFGRTAGREQRDAMLRKRAGEIDQSRLVGNRQERASDGAERHGRLGSGNFRPLLRPREPKEKGLDDVGRQVRGVRRTSKMTPVRVARSSSSIVSAGVR